MKPILATSLRHAFTALAGLGGFLLARGAIGSADVQSVDAAGATLGDALSVIAAALVARLVVWISGMIVTGGSASMIALCLCIAGTLSVGGLAACSPGDRVTASLGYHDPHTGATAGLTYSPAIAPRVRGDK